MAKAIREGRQDLATEEKQKVENNQRALLKSRTQSGKIWQHRFFHLVEAEAKWKLKVLCE